MSDFIISFFTVLISSGSLIAAIIHRIISNHQKNITHVEYNNTGIDDSSLISEDVAKVLKKLVEMNQNIKDLNEKVNQLEAERSSITKD